MLRILQAFSRLRTGRFLQYAAATTAALSFLIAGTIASWVSPTLPKLQEPDSPIPITNDQGSWIVSVLGLGGILPPFFTGYLVNRFGRKMTLMFTAFPVLLSWFLVIIASSVAELLVARIIFGVSIGTFMAVCPMYIAEIAEEDIRGILGSLMQLLMNVGTMFAYCVGPYVSYMTLAILSAVFPTVFLLLLLLMPETPVFYVTKNKIDEAETSLMRLRGKNSPEQVKEELERMKASVEEQMKQKGRLRDLVATRGTRRALVIMTGLVLIQQCGGVMAILSYAEQIFRMTPGSALTASQSAIVIGGVQILSSIGSTSLVDRLGRRVLLLISTLGCGISLAILAVYLYLNIETTISTESFSWIPITTLMGFLVSYCLGVGPLPVAIFSEIFPTNIKGLAMSLGTMALSLGFVIVTKLYQVMVDNIGIYSAFGLFAASSILGAIFVFFCVPETKGKKLEDIVSELNGRKKENIPAEKKEAIAVYTITA